MNKTNIKAAMLAGAICALSGFGLTACNTGTEPGDTNVERGKIVEPEETTVQTPDAGDTTNYEEHYDHADHDDHADNKPGSAL